MKGKWAAGIPPRNFAWVIRDRLALSERPGGFAPNHRRVRRQEELIWLRAQGLNKIISLLPSQHNLQVYEDEKIAHAHYPLVPGVDPRPTLQECFADVEDSLRDGARVLVHQEEMGDRVMGVAAGFLVWSKRVPSEPQAIALVEHLIGHQMGPGGRELVVAAAALGSRTSR